jgi:hypothetical protein
MGGKSLLYEIQHDSFGDHVNHGSPRDVEVAIDE